MYQSYHNRIVNYQSKSSKCLVAIGIFFLMLSNAISTSICAQPSSELIKVDGLKSNLVYCVMQDSKGYIWAGTDEGIARFDGSKFRFYSVEEGLPDNDIFQIFEDSQGRLWMLNYSGKPVFFQNEKIHTAANTPWLSSVQPKRLAVSFLKLADGSFWYVTNDSAYHFYKDKVLERYGLNINSKWGIQSVMYINNKPWVVHNGGVSDIIEQKGKFLPFNENNSIISTHTRTFHRNNSLFYFANYSLLLFDIKSIKNKLIYKFDVDDAGLVMIQSGNSDTLMVTSKKKNIYVDIKTGKVLMSRKSTIEFITGRCIDQEGNVWISSLSDGLYRTKFKFGQIQRIAHPSLPIGITCNRIQQIDRELFWSFNGRYYMYTKGGEIFADSSLVINKSYKSLKSFVKTKNTLWVALSSNLLEKGPKNFLYSMPAKDIVINKRGMYIAASNGVHYIGNKANYSSVLNTGLLDKMSPHTTSCLLSVGDDSLFAGGIYGMKLFVRNKLATLPGVDFLTSKQIRRIILGRNRDIVFATSGYGIGIIHGDSIYQISKISGLLSDFCNSVSLAPDGGYWVSSAKGLNYIKVDFNGNQAVTRVYTLELVNKQLAVYDALQTGDSLLIAENDGAFVYRLNKNNYSGVIAKTLIEGFYVNDQLYDHRKPVTLDYKKSKISVDFNRVLFNVNASVRFRYKLLPVDTFWRYADSKHIDFPYLPPGRYQFVVNSFIGTEFSGASSASVFFEIMPPIWKRGYFIGAVLLLLILTGIIFFKLRVKDIRAKAEIVRKVNELETKALRLQMNPHFIFNAINAIKGFYASGNKSDANHYIGLFSDLMRLMLETGGQSVISLEKEIGILENYLKLSAYRYNHCFEFSIDTKILVPLAELQIPILLIQPFVENAVVHGVAPLKTGGLISIIIRQEQNILHCYIEDNGVGREASVKSKNNRLHNSKGIAITEQRLKLHQGNMSITDLQDANGNATGTLVYLAIPLI